MSKKKPVPIRKKKRRRGNLCCSMDGCRASIVGHIEDAPGWSLVGHKPYCEYCIPDIPDEMDANIVADFLNKYATRNTSSMCGWVGDRLRELAEKIRTDLL